MTKALPSLQGEGSGVGSVTGVAARDGWASAAKQAHADGEDKLMAVDVFEEETMEDWKW